jgi:hypothetical protein
MGRSRSRRIPRSSEKAYGSRTSPRRNGGLTRRGIRDKSCVLHLSMDGNARRRDVASQSLCRTNSQATRFHDCLNLQRRRTPFVARSGIPARIGPGVLPAPRSICTWRYNRVVFLLPTWGWPKALGGIQSIADRSSPEWRLWAWSDRLIRVRYCAPKAPNLKAPNLKALGRDLGSHIYMILRKTANCLVPSKSALKRTEAT